MLYRKLSQQKIINSTLTTYETNMNNKVEIHVNYCLDSALWLGILMLRTKATETLKLSFLLKINPEHIRSEYSIINLQMFDFCVIWLPYSSFKMNILNHSLSFSNGNIILNTSYVSYRISKNSPTTKIQARLLTDTYTWKETGVLKMDLYY